MPIIFTYPTKTTLVDGDLFLISDSADDNKTKNTTLKAIKETLDPIGVGTPLNVPLWITDKTLGDSIISQPSSSYISINGLAYQEAGGSTYFGKNAGRNDDQTSSNNNVGLGEGALTTQVTGEFSGVSIPSENVGIGYQALNATTTGTNNVAIGADSLSGNTTGFNNVAISKNALGTYLINNTSVGIGFSAGNPLASSGAIDGHVGNTMVGHQSLADFNVAAASNVRYNVALGFRALRNLGGSGGNLVTAIEDNVVIGRQAGLNITPTGDIEVKRNVLIGQNAGFDVSPGSTVLSNNILIGRGAAQQQYVSNANVVLQSNTGTIGLGKVDTSGASDVPYPVSENIIIGGRANVFANDNIVISNADSGSTNVIGREITGDTEIASTIKNVILGGSANIIRNNGAQVANNNAIISSDTITLAASASQPSQANLFASSASITTDGASRNAFIVSRDMTAFKGTDNVLLNASTTAMNGNDNVVMSSENADIKGNSNIVSVGSDVTISTGANFNIAFGNDHTVSPAAGTVARNLVTGNNHQVRGGNNGFVGGTNSTLESGDHSFVYGNGLTSENDNCASVGKFNNSSPTGQDNGLFQVGCGFNKTTGARNAINIASANLTLSSGSSRNNSAIVYLDELVFQDYTDDSEAADGGIEVGGLYHNAGVVRIRIS